MRTVGKIKELTNTITEALDPLRRRLRAREIAELSRGLASRPGSTSLATALLDYADDAAARRTEGLLALAKLQNALAYAAPQEERRLLAAFLRRKKAPRGDVGAVRRRLDFLAIAEREARVTARHDGIREVCLVAAGSLASASDALAGRFLEHARDRKSPFTVRTAALAALATMAETTAGKTAFDEKTEEELFALAVNEGENRWVEIGAARALAARSPARARQIFADVSTRKDPIVRAGLARLLGEISDPTLLYALAALATDPSEYVRQSAARACAHLPAWSYSVLAGLLDITREPEATVRAVGVRALAVRISNAQGGDAAIRLLARVVREDPSPLVKRIACNEAARICQARDDARILLAALDDARATVVSPDIVNQVARAAERALVSQEAPFAELKDKLTAVVAELDEQAQVRVRIPPAEDAVLGRVLAALAQDDFGLYARRTDDMLVIRRGERTVRKTWRVIHELMNPVPMKRQGHLHTVGRIYDEPLRAHPARLAEVTCTRVPGERVHIPSEGGWGGYLPLVDDLLAALDGPCHLYSEHGFTTIAPPLAFTRRLWTRGELATRYAELAALRLASLGATTPHGRRAYHDAVKALGFALAFTPYPETNAPGHIQELLAPTLAGLIPADALFAAARAITETPRADVGELAAFVLSATVFLLGRSLATRAEVRAARRSVPLVIGGWGTRGKSGVERLKGALFHALGYETVVKTTGCQATIILGTPGRTLVEVPLYRPYDKATIWEQRDVLRLVRVWRPHVFSWECMALRPKYVSFLQDGWMQDDITTLTNAYPDHEDLQGPSGIDVARVIAGFIPKRSTAITTEEQMLPIFREKARSRKTRLVSVDSDEAALIPNELLRRFPYREHPKNIALVLALAEELGIDRDLALVEMADHVLPDIGGLLTYGPIVAHRRQIRFTNIMSANERASAGESWRREGFDKHDPALEPARLLVMFVNNRADRPTRSLVFAEALTWDFAAHEVVLVGSGIPTMRRALARAISERVARLDGQDVPALLTQWKIGEATPRAAHSEWSAWLESLGVTPLPLTDDLATCLDSVFSPTGGENLARARMNVNATAALTLWKQLYPQYGELAPFLAESWAKRRVGASLAHVTDARDRARLLADLHASRVRVPPYPKGPADALIEYMASLAPPGCMIDIVGVENIKGPGLDMVRRFGSSPPSPPPSRWNLHGLDHLSSVTRRREADKIMRELAKERIARVRAAAEISKLLAEQGRRE